MKLFYFNLCFLLFICSVRSQIPQDNLIFWVNGNVVDTSNGRLQQWTDQSLQNNHAIQSNIGNQPNIIVNSLEWGGQTIIDFDRSNANFVSTLSPVLNSTDFSIFIVYRSKNMNIQMDLIGQYENGISGRTAWGVNKFSQPNFFIGGGINLSILHEGNGLVILPGVTIGDNVVIAANSVVNKNIPSNVIAGGIPCKVIKEKSEYKGIDYSNIQ